MHIAITRLDEHIARFTLSGTTPAFANAFRRAMISEVPTLAIEDVRIYDNNSALFDEMLAHRLGQIPLHTDLETLVAADQCSCGGVGCPGCCVTYTLSVEGPKMVYSGDLIPEDPKAAPVHDNIPIVKLIDGQKIVLEARAVINTGKEHAKWQSTIACGYKAYPVIRIDDRCDACGMCVEECPRGVLRTGGRTVEIVDGRLEYCSLCRLCERACLAGGIGEQPAIHVTPDPSRYIFVVESDGSLPVREIMERALLFLKRQSKDLVDILRDISGGTANETSS
ncbi:MAG: DNA-directed RNA polymerase subunit D [Methanomicrobiales archaeon]|nr:DNA-directed RNA polymerase subunit D [Methanomicrobiales archaeon]